jgi:thiol-disulfide isomerase/thioredoxin
VIAHHDCHSKQEQQQWCPQRQNEKPENDHGRTLAASADQAWQSAGIAVLLMTGSTPQPLLGQAQKLLLLAVALGLAVTLVAVRGGFQSESPLEQLAGRSLEPDVALANGRPTMIEFYADWCQACRAMAPAMLSLEKSTQGKLDVVMVNVDNPRWQDLVDRYDVNGIPQLDLFGPDGTPRGRSIGLRQPEDLKAISEALIQDKALPGLQGMGSVSPVRSSDLATTGTTTGPRSHG